MTTQVEKLATRSARPGETSGRDLQGFLQDLRGHVNADLDLDAVGLALVTEAAAFADCSLGAFLRWDAGTDGQALGARVIGTIPDVGRSVAANLDSLWASIWDRVAASPSTVRLPELGQGLAVPVMTADGAVAGVLVLGFPRTEGFTGDGERTLVALAAWMALAVDHARAQTDRAKAVRARESTVSVVSHDLRTPLQVIRCAAELVREDPKGAPDYAARILRSSDQMVALVSDLLDVAAMESGRLRVGLEDVEGDSFVRDVTEAPLSTVVSKAAERGVTVVVQATGSFPHLRADRGRVARALASLVEGAVRASPDHGVVTVAASAESPACVRFEVSDRGPAIQPEQQGRLFQPFHRAKGEARSVSGLPLAIARGVIEAHGGRMGAESDEHETRFWFTLPAG
jgi:signal transduction histidine kinase